MHLLDANVLIRADADFYPLDRIPQFWDWLAEQGANGNVKIPLEIYDEITAGNGALPDWVADNDVKAALLLDEEPDTVLVQHALDNGYQAQHANFNDGELIKIGRDAFLVAYALAADGRVIVTREVSRRTKRLGASKLPDACDDCGVSWTTDYEMYRLLDFNLKGK
ncbi:MAG: DUF4411 family protein [Pseudomonadota bacterium]